MGVPIQKSEAMSLFPYGRMPITARDMRASIIENRTKDPEVRKQVLDYYMQTIFDMLNVAKIKQHSYDPIEINMKVLKKKFDDSQWRSVPSQRIIPENFYNEISEYFTSLGYVVKVIPESELIFLSF